MKCSVCGREIKHVRPCLYNRYGKFTCDDCCEECHNSEPFPCREYDFRHSTKQMERKEFVRAMEAFGFPYREALKMADYALLDFGSYQDALSITCTTADFWMGLLSRDIERPGEHSRNSTF